MSRLLLQPGQTVLFIGDSITDCQRDRQNPDDLGRGYAWMTAASLQASYPELGLRFLNRGISGNRTRDLRERWTQDCLDLRPDWVSLFAGINDTWRRYDRQDPTSVEEFRANYEACLLATRSALPNTRLLLLEPFVLPVPPDRAAWREDLDPKLAVVRELAVRHGARLVPLDGLFQAAATRAPAAFWAPDGVHPSPAGHALISRAWRDAVGAE